MIRKYPPASVLDAFQAKNPVLLPGGEGRTYRARNIILKPADNERETSWIAETLNGIKRGGFRLPLYIKSTTGKWVVNGWSAQQYVEGRHSKTRWKEVIETCVLFHKALRRVPKPTFISKKMSPWSVADRIAWGEQKVVCYPQLKDLLTCLFSVIRPVNLPNQLIHGDFTENILFADDLPPAVIDFSPYWRPGEFAVAIVVADALVWGGAKASILEYVKDMTEINQMIVRAEIRRIMELDGLYRQYGEDKLHEIVAHEKTVKLICSKALED